MAFSNPDFLRQYGLTAQNALDYFYSSPFYALCGGAQSLNEQRRRGTATPVITADLAEFVVAYANEDAKQGRVETSVIVIEKVIHKGDQDGGVVPRDIFYIITGTIYKAPQLDEVFSGTFRVAAVAAERILAVQLDDLAAKRRRLNSAVSGTQSGASDSTVPTGSRPSSAACTTAKSPWPEWVHFERKQLPAAWLRDAVGCHSETAHSVAAVADSAIVRPG